MKQRPIIFNGEMVQAILAGNKTQTRRSLKRYYIDDDQQLKMCSDGNFHWWLKGAETYHSHAVYCPFGKVGDQLWVRETWNRTNPNGDNGVYYYRADGKFPEYLGGKEYNGDEKWKPAIHMPRCASRITLEITDIRVERLQDISEHDAVAEGAPHSHPTIDAVSQQFGFPDFSRSWFGQKWNHIYNNWNDNPWVFVISFKRI